MCIRDRYIVLFNMELENNSKLLAYKDIRIKLLYIKDIKITMLMIENDATKK